MRALHRIAVLTLVVTTLGPRAVTAAPITVAEFRWDTIVDEAEGCSAADPACVLSVFSLTNLWDGSVPGPTLTNNALTLPSGVLQFFDLEPGFPFNFDQLSEIGLPAFAALSTSFVFEGEVVSLGATLTRPNTFEVLRFNPTTVPEPGTLGLLALGVAALVRHARHAGKRS